LTTGCTQKLQVVRPYELPASIRGERRAAKELVPLSKLTQPKPDAYQLAPGDVLGVYITGTDYLGSETQPLPVSIPAPGSGLLPSTGFPIPVDENGEISLPRIGNMNVNGSTLVEARRKIRKAYFEPEDEEPYLNEGSEILLSLSRPRTHQVIVIREDSALERQNSSFQGSEGARNGGILGTARRGTAHVVDLPQYQNDLAHALARTGGLPGLDAKNEVKIYRKVFNHESDADSLEGNGSWKDLESEVVTIPVRLRPGKTLDFNPEDIILHTGDVIAIEARDTEVFYTGGLLDGSQFPLPRDYDLDVVDAIAFSGGSIVGSTGRNSLFGGRGSGSGLGGIIPPSKLVVVRTLADNARVAIRIDLNRALTDINERVIVQPGDLLLLNYTQPELMGNIFLSIFNFRNLQRNFVQ